MLSQVCDVSMNCIDVQMSNVNEPAKTYSAPALTDPLCQVVPFELWQVLDVPHVVMVMAILLPADNSGIQDLGDLFRHRLVQEFDPSFRVVLLLVPCVLFAACRNLGI